MRWPDSDTHTGSADRATSRPAVSLSTTCAATDATFNRSNAPPSSADAPWRTACWMLMTRLPSARVSSGADTTTVCGTNQLVRSNTSVSPASTGVPTATPLTVRTSARPWPPAFWSALPGATGAAVT